MAEPITAKILVDLGMSQDEAEFMAAVETGERTGDIVEPEEDATARRRNKRIARKGAEK